MAPLSFFKPSSGSGQGERGGISRDIISRPRALSNSGFEHPGYAFSDTFADLPALERPSTPPQPCVNSNNVLGPGLARSASASGGSSPNNPHGSPGRYNPARLLRRKAPRRGEREDAWGAGLEGGAGGAGGAGGGAGAGAGSSPSTLALPPGALPPGIPAANAAVNHANATASTSAVTPTTPSLTVSPPRPSGRPPSADADRRARGHVARAHSESGIPLPTSLMYPLSAVSAVTASNFGSVRSMRSMRSLGSDGDGETISIHTGGYAPGGALAAAFDPPLSAVGGGHPFLAQMAQGSGSAAASAAPAANSLDASPLTPPRRAHPPPPRRTTHPVPKALHSWHEDTTRSHSRPMSPASNTSAGSDSPPPISRDMANWLARRPSGRRRLPLPLATDLTLPTSPTSPTSPTTPNGRRSYSDRSLRRVASQSSTHTHSSTSHGVTPITDFTAPPLGPSRMSFGPSTFSQFGMTTADDAASSSRSASGSMGGPLSASSASSPSASPFSSPPVTRAMDFEEGVADRPRTPERQSRRTGDNYDVSVVCTPGDDEVRWEVVIRRAPEYGGAVPPPGPLALVGPTGSNTASQSRTHAPSLASSINLSLGLDVEQPTGKLVFIALPDANSTPTRARPSTMSPRASLSGASSHTTPPVPPAPAPAPAPALAAPSALPSPLPQPPQPPVRSSPAVGSNSSAEGGTPPSSRSPVSVSQTSLPATPELPSAPGDTPTLPVPQRQRKRHGVQDLFAISTTNVAPPPPPRRDHRRGASLSPYTPSSASSTASPIFVMTGTPVASRAGTPRLSSSTFASSRPLPLPPRPDRPLRLQSSGSASSSISTGSVGSVGSIAPSPVAALLGSVAPSPNTPHTPHTNGLPQPPVPVQTPTPPPHALPSPPVSTGPKAMPPLPAVPLPAVPLPSDPLRAVPHPAVPLPAVPAPNGRHASPNRLPIPPTAQP